MAEVETQIMEQVNNETEELQFQLDNLRKDLVVIKKKKEKEQQERGPFGEFSFDNGDSDGNDRTQGLSVKCLQEMKTDVKSLQVEMESV